MSKDLFPLILRLQVEDAKRPVWDSAVSRL